MLTRCVPALVLVLTMVWITTAAAQSCPAADGSPWLEDIAEGRFEAALGRIAAWSKAPGCSCEDAASNCLTLAVDGAERAVSPDALSRVVSEASAWSTRTRNACAPLAGSDEVGRVAFEACWRRNAEQMTGIDDTLSRELLAGALSRAAARLATEDTADQADGPREERMSEASPGSRVKERADQKARDIAAELCDMMRKTAQLRERIDNMKRQPPFIAGEQQNRLWQVQDDLMRLNEAISRGREQFTYFASRDFDADRDCRPEPLTPQ